MPEVIKSGIVGKEQLILLPVTSQVFTLTTDPPGQVKMQTGIHAIVVSGYIGIDPNGEVGAWLVTNDDEVVYTREIHQLVGPLWRRIQQVSASRVCSSTYITSDPTPPPNRRPL